MNFFPPKRVTYNTSKLLRHCPEMLIITQKGVGSQEFKWYKNKLHNRGAKMPFKSAVGSLPPQLSPGMKNT